MQRDKAGDIESRIANICPQFFWHKHALPHCGFILKQVGDDGASYDEARLQKPLDSSLRLLPVHADLSLL